MPATMTTINGITKEIYQGKIQEQLQNEVIGLKRIESSAAGVTSEVGGKYVTFPIRVRRNQGIGYRNEAEQLAAAGQQGFASVRVGLKYGYGRVRLTGQTMKLAKTNPQAFANAMDLEMNGLKDDIVKDSCRIFYGDGLGTLAVISTAAVANQVVVVSTKYLEVGQVIDIVSPAGTVRGALRNITAINTATNVVTYDGADILTDAAADLIVRAGNYGREPNGLASIVTATGVLFNVDPTVEPSWAAIVDSNAGVNRALSEGLMIKNTDLTRTKGGKTSLILVGLDVRRSYFNLLSQQRRYPATKDFAGGLSGLAFNNGREIPVVEDIDAPDNTMWFLDESSFTVYRESPWEWQDGDGDVWKWVHDFDSWEALLAQYWEIGTNRRNANAVMKDITGG